MRKQSRSHGSSVRRPRAAARRHFRPRGESLEARLALAVGVFNEDFSDDVDVSMPSFDQFDTYPARDINPADPGDISYDDPNTINTVLPDDMLIANDLPRYPTGLEGSTGRNGRYFVQNGNPGDPGWGLHAHGHVLGIVSSAFLTPQVTFTVPAPGTPGGLAADEEVSGIGVSVQGFGRVVIIGAIGSITVQLPGNSTWQRIAAFRDDVLPGGAPLGAIQALHIFSAEFVAIDNVTVEVSETVQNTPPEANDDTIIVDRRFGVSELFNPLENDFDPQGDAFAIQSYTQPAHGIIQEFFDPLGNLRGFTYRASAAALADPTFREDSFTYVIGPPNSGHSSATDTGTVRLVLNTPPIALFDEYEVPHGTTGPLTIDAAHGLLDNDFDRDDSDSLTITAHGQPRHGNVTIMPDGSFQYTPTTPDGRVLPDGFPYTISDGSYQAHSFVLIHVPNEVPIVRDDFLVVEHGLFAIDAFDVTTNDPGDPDGDPVGLPQIVTPPQYGTLTERPDGRLRYVPTGDHVFSDTFTYRRADPYAASDGTSDLATVRILVPNELPVAVSDEYRSDEYRVSDGTLVVPAADGVLRNDSDPDGDPVLGVTLTKQPGYGTVTLQDDGSFTYTPDVPFQGTDSFGYTISDGIGESHAATVTLAMNFIDGGLVANHDRFVIEPDSEPIQLDILANDWDPQGRLFEFRIPTDFGPSHGQLFPIRDGLPVYQPEPGFEGIDSFDYYLEATNGISHSHRVRVTLQVTDDPTVPVANADQYSLLHDTTRTIPSTIGLLINDSFNPGPFASIMLDRAPNFGTLNGLDLNFAGAFTYTPNPGFVGTDTFRYWIAENGYESEAQTVSITVTNQVPIAQDDFFPIARDSYVWGNVLTNDADADAHETFTVELLSQPEQGIAILEPDGDFYFQPEPGWTGLVRVAYRVFDGAGYSEAGLISVGSAYENVAYLSTPDRRIVIVESTPGTLLEASVSDTPPQPTPAGVEFPLGYFSFVIHNLPADGRATVRLQLPSNPPAINQYWKYGQDANDPHDLWYEFNQLGDTGAELLPGEIVLHFVDGQRGDSDLLANGVIVDPGGPAFAALPPHVQSVTINDGAAQRSKVNSITITFSELVSIDPGAFEVRKNGARHPMKLHVELSQSAGRTVAKLTFKGTGIIGGSLADGQYKLSIDADKIRDAEGDLLDGDGDGEAGGDFVDEFFRRFGDTDGDGDVDAADKSVFKSAYGKRSHQSGYLWYLDFNANGRIWAEDAALFLLGYCRSSHRR